jgi:hypothetical protein
LRRTRLNAQSAFGGQAEDMGSIPVFRKI